MGWGGGGRGAAKGHVSVADVSSFFLLYITPLADSHQLPPTGWGTGGHVSPNGNLYQVAEHF